MMGSGVKVASESKVPRPQIPWQRILDHNVKIPGRCSDALLK